MAVKELVKKFTETFAPQAEPEAENGIRVLDNVVNTLTDAPPQAGVSTRYVASYFDSLSAGLQMHKRFNYTNQMGNFMESDKEPVRFEGDLEARVKSVFTNFFAKGGWTSPASMDAAWNAIPVEMKNIEFDGGDTTPAHIYGQSRSRLSFNLATAGNVVDISTVKKAPAASETEHFLHAETPGASLR